MSICRVFCLCCLFLVPAFPALADVSVLQKLRFGELIITDNNNKYDIVVNVDGSFGHSGEIISIEDPQPGIYEIDDLIPNTVITVTGTQIQPLTRSGNQFTLKDFQIINTNSDPTGTASVTLGATAETSGNGVMYAGGTYNGIIELQVSY